MNTKNILKWIMSLCITTILLGSCKDNDSMGPLAEAVPLKLELSKKYLVFGKNVRFVKHVFVMKSWPMKKPYKVTS